MEPSSGSAARANSAAWRHRSPMAKRPFVLRPYFRQALYESARIIGYDDVAMAAFRKADKKLSLPQNDVLKAAYDLTGADKRGQPTQVRPGQRGAGASAS